jgi:hypothetical protein
LLNKRLRRSNNLVSQKLSSTLLPEAANASTSATNFSTSGVFLTFVEIRDTELVLGVDLEIGIICFAFFGKQADVVVIILAQNDNPQDQSVFIVQNLEFHFG